MDNWYMIIALTCVMALIITTVINWLKLPTAQKIKDVKQWLCFAVSEAEKKLKSGTGQLKLRTVYDMFLERFPELKIYITFDRFSLWVKEALEWMKKELETNPAFKEYIYGDND